jgi:shikimate 5-dehydrogenase
LPEKVYLLANPAPASELAALRAKAAAEKGAELDFVPAILNGDKLGDRLRSLMSDPEALGVEILTPYGLDAAKSCDGLSHLAQHSAAVSAVVRRGEGDTRIVGRNLLAKAFRNALEDAGVSSVRTALILGTGAAARSCMAALHEMGCNRFLVGFRISWDSGRSAALQRSATSSATGSASCISFRCRKCLTSSPGHSPRTVLNLS